MRWISIFDEEELKKIELLKLLEFKKKAALDYEKHKGQFVVITKKDNSKVIGIFEYITPDFNLYIKGKHCDRRVDPLKIGDFYGRADKFSKRGGYHQR